MLSILNVDLAWILIISTVVFVSGGSTTHKKERRVIKLPKLMLPKIVFIPVGTTVDVEPDAQNIVPLISKKPLNENDLLKSVSVEEIIPKDPNEIIKESETIDSDQEKSENTDPTDEESCDIVLEDTLEPEEQDLPIYMSFSDSGMTVPLPCSEEQMEETIESLEDTGRWEEKITPETASFDFDPKSFYSDVIPMTPEVSNF